MSLELVGKCGLYCGACSIYRAQRDDPHWQAELAREFKCKPEQVRCNGCGALTDACWGKGCPIVLCTAEKGYRYCYECPKYRADTCEAFGKLAERYLRSGVDVRANLAQIESGATAEWLERCREKFSCPSCGQPVTVSARRCRVCGSNLE